METGEFVYLNGFLVPADQAKVSLFERGLLFGDGLFETMRAYSGSIFRLDRHLQRLWRSLGFLKIPFFLSPESVREILSQLLEANHLTEAYIRMMVWRGEGFGVDPDASSSSMTAIIARPFVPYPSASYARGFRGTLITIRQNEWSPFSRMKSLSFLPNIVARIEAKARGGDEGILLNTKGDVAEGAISNIFVVLTDRLLTPSLESGVLPGITREAILELASQEGLRVTEGRVTPSDLMAAEEAFLTNTLMEVMPMTTIDHAPIGSGKPGPVTQRLSRAYRGLVARETGAL